MLMLAGCGGDSTNPTSTADPNQVVTYSVVVRNEAGTALEKLTLEIYTDDTLSDILQVLKTDSDGVASFNRKGSADGLVAVIKNAPIGYQVADKYLLTDKTTEITLKACNPITEESFNSGRLTLGDAMPDFSVTASDGTVFTLSEVLNNHKAVVLNFWYMGCTPCKMEFPYLQEAYEEFAEDVAVIAVNPMDSTDSEIETFRQTNGYTYLMGKCDARWSKLFNISAYPVTVVIDRYGNITMIHNGAADGTQMFRDIFGFFAAEDYQQTFVRSHSQLPTYEA